MMDLLDEFLEQNEAKVEHDNEELGDEGSIDQVEKDIKDIEVLLKQLDHFENSYLQLKNNELVRSKDQIEEFF